MEEEEEERAGLSVFNMAVTPTRPTPTRQRDQQKTKQAVTVPGMAQNQSVWSRFGDVTKVSLHGTKDRIYMHDTLVLIPSDYLSEFMSLSFRIPSS